MPRRPSAPLFATTWPGRRRMRSVSRTSYVPPTMSGAPSSRRGSGASAGAERARGSSFPDASGSASSRNARATSTSGTAYVQEPAVVGQGDDVCRRPAEQARDRVAHRELALVRGIRVVVHRPAGVAAQTGCARGDSRSTCGASGRRPRCRARGATAVRASSGMPSAPQVEQRLAHVGTPEHRLERPHMLVLARVRAGHDRQLLARQGQLVGRTRLDERDDPERLDGRAHRDDDGRVPDRACDVADGVDLDDVPAMTALDDALTEDLHEHGRWESGLRLRGPAPRRSKGGRGGRGRRDGHVSRWYRGASDPAHRTAGHEPSAPLSSRPLGTEGWGDRRR